MVAVNVRTEPVESELAVQSLAAQGSSAKDAIDPEASRTKLGYSQKEPVNLGLTVLLTLYF